MLVEVERIELAEAGEAGHVVAPVLPLPAIMPQPPEDRSAALARFQYASCASSGRSAMRVPSAAAKASMARKRRSNLWLARRSAVPTSTFAWRARLAATN